MNRFTALLLAFAALLTHVLVVHRDLDGTFGPPYESAHVAFQIARNFVTEGAFSWWHDPASHETFGGLWSYPSPLLVFLSAGFERVYLPVTRGVQVMGITSVLATVWLCTRFDPIRILSVVSALLMVSCGAVAAAGGSGTEWPLVMALATTAFVALEKGRPRSAAAALALLTISTASAILFVVVLFVQTMIKRELFGSRSRARRILYFLPAVATLAVAELAGASLLAELKRILTFDPSRAAHGVNQLRDFFVSTVSPLLLIYPLVALALGELSPLGRRALMLLVTWCVATVMAGGGPSTFDLAFVPALPFAFIAIQQGLTRALDTYRPNMERLAWASILVASVGSLAVNRFPDAPSETSESTVFERLLAPAAQRWPEPDLALGRPSLYSEVRDTNHLRRIGGFLRNRLPEETTLLSPWPGAIGYLVHFHVLDLFGRTDALPGYSATAWTPHPPEAHVEAALSSEPDYILPWTKGFEVLQQGDFQDGLSQSFLGLDPDQRPSYRAAIRAQMKAYEPMVTAGRRGMSPKPIPPFLLLRRTGVSTPPIIRHRMRQGRTLEFAAGFGTPGEKPRSHGLPQIFDTVVTAVRADGSRSILDPVGKERISLGEEAPSATMTGIVIDPRWATEVSLARIPMDLLQTVPRIERIEVRLVHHQLPTASSVSNAAEPYIYEVQ